MAVGLPAGGFIQIRWYFDQLFVIYLAIAGFIFGFPKIKNMILLAAFSAFGGVLGYRICVFGQNFVYYLNSV